MARRRNRKKPLQKKRDDNGRLGSRQSLPQRPVQSLQEVPPQPPQTVQTEASQSTSHSPWEQVRNKWHHPRPKESLINSSYFLSGAFFITLAVLSHKNTVTKETNDGNITTLIETCQHGGVKHWAIFHIENWNSWIGSHLLGWLNHNWQMGLFETWDFLALAITLAFSIILLFECKTDKFLVSTIWVVIIVGTIGLVSVGYHSTKFYPIALSIVLVALFLADFVSYVLSKYQEKVYKRLLFFVDIPMIISLALLLCYEGFQLRHQEFFSGAIAFQFLMGNIVLYLVRGYGRINAKDSNWWSVLWALSYVFLLEPLLDIALVIRRLGKMVPFFNSS